MRLWLTIVGNYQSEEVLCKDISYSDVFKHEIVKVVFHFPCVCFLGFTGKSKQLIQQVLSVCCCQYKLYIHWFEKQLHAQEKLCCLPCYQFWTSMPWRTKPCLLNRLGQCTGFIRVLQRFHNCIVVDSISSKIYLY